MAYRPGTSATETLDGTALNDFFKVSGGSDTYRAFAGFDKLDARGETAGIQVDNFVDSLQQFTLTTLGASETSTMQGFEKIFGTNFADEFTVASGTTYTHDLEIVAGVPQTHPAHCKMGRAFCFDECEKSHIGFIVRSCIMDPRRELL